MIDRLTAALSTRYRIDRELGAGGMATVYLATDLKHDRLVAIKVLKPELTAALGAERFLAEIRTTANLQHPHILPLFDSGEADGLLWYAMPYVEGESLRERLERERQLQIQEAVKIASVVAGALDHAHRRGVVHRDVKPANILLHDGQPVVADFGIALAVKEAGEARLTDTGLSLGTPHYMSPEQASGDQAASPASDIYALGCVLFEMLAGEPPFTGSTTQAVIGKLLTKSPESLTSLRKAVPENVASVVRRALEKVPADRFATAGAFVEALSDPTYRYDAADIAQPAGAGSRVSRIAMVLLVAVTAAAGFVAGRSADRDGAPAAEPVRFMIELPAEAPLAASDLPAVALSADGRHLVYAGRSDAGTQLYRRDLNAIDVVPIAGTQAARGPFFSPDGSWVGYFAEGKLRKIPLAGGVPEDLAEAALARGASWGPDGSIFFTSAPGTGLWGIGSDGGPPRPITQLDSATAERTHRFPQVLGRGESVLFTARNGSHPTFDAATIEVFRMDTGARDLILEGGSQGRVLPTGHLLFARGGTLYASSAEPGSSAPVALVDGLMTDPSTGAAHFAVSDAGTLAYVMGEPWVAARSLVLLAPAADAVSFLETIGPFQTPRVSPADPDLVAVTIEAASDDIWIYDTGGGAPRRFTFAAGSNVSPIWSPDGARIVFASNRAGRYNLYVKDADGSGEAERLTSADLIQFPSSWHPDGSTIAFTQTSTSSGDDVWTYSVESGQSEPLLVSEFDEFGAAFHPQLPWFAYVSDENGTDQVYLARYPSLTGKLQVTTSGGNDPVWSPDGARLFFRVGAEVHSVSIGFEATPSVSATRPEADLPRQSLVVTSVRNFDLAPGGRGVIAVEDRERTPPTTIHVILNFFAELRARVPVR